MEKSTDRIDRIFFLMEKWFGERWTKQYKNKEIESIAKTEWRSALHGLTEQELDHGLKIVDWSAKNPAVVPPHQLEFWRFCKQRRGAFTAGILNADRKESSEDTLKIIADIKDKLKKH
jgi:hypothetical protein